MGRALPWLLSAFLFAAVTSTTAVASDAVAEDPADAPPPPPFLEGDFELDPEGAPADEAGGTRDNAPSDEERPVDPLSVDDLPDERPVDPLSVDDLPGELPDERPDDEAASVDRPPPPPPREPSPAMLAVGGAIGAAGGLFVAGVMSFIISPATAIAFLPAGAAAGAYVVAWDLPLERQALYAGGAGIGALLAAPVGGVLGAVAGGGGALASGVPVEGAIWLGVAGAGVGALVGALVGGGAGAALPALFSPPRGGE